MFYVSLRIPQVRFMITDNVLGGKCIQNTGLTIPTFKTLCNICLAKQRFKDYLNNEITGLFLKLCFDKVLNLYREAE